MDLNLITYVTCWVMIENYSVKELFILSNDFSSLATVASKHAMNEFIFFFFSGTLNKRDIDLYLNRWGLA